MARFARDLRDFAPLRASLPARKIAEGDTRLCEDNIHFHRSAQSIVTEALDRYLADLPQARALAGGLQ